MGDGKYEIVPAAALNYGREYDIFASNGLAAPSGAIGFEEPDEDDNDDGMWHLASFEAAEYALSIISVLNDDEVSVEFKNDGAVGKDIVVTWFNDDNRMVDFAICEIDEHTTSPIFAERTNSAPATKVFVYVLDIAENGAMNIYDVN